MMPIRVSVPHAGDQVPEQWRELCVLGLRGLREDADEQARDVYDIAPRVADFVTTSTARAVVDLNRAPEDFGADGVVKTETCWRAPIWKRPLTTAERQTLLDEHYFPYHERLSAPPDDIRCGFDLHTMAATAPPIAPVPGKKRPLACISNADGTAPSRWMEVLADAMEQVLPARPSINDPFRGGHITRFHAREMPWIQIELSRAPFLGVDEKRSAILEALERFCDEALTRPSRERPPRTRRHPEHSTMTSRWHTRAPAGRNT